MSLLNIVRARVLVDELCAAIDAGTVAPTEEEIVALAVGMQREAGPLPHDLLVKLASRCPNGRMFWPAWRTEPEGSGMSPKKDATNYVGAYRAHLQAVNSDITRLRTMLRDEQRKRRALRWQLLLAWMKLLRGLVV